MSFALVSRDAFSGGGSQFEWEKDYDTDTMRCQVSIWTRPVSAFKNVNKETTSSLLKSLFSSKKSKSKKHGIGEFDSDTYQDSYGDSFSNNYRSIGYGESNDYSYSRGFNSKYDDIDSYSSSRDYHSIGDSYSNSRRDSYDDYNSNRNTNDNYNSPENNQEDENSYKPLTKHWALVFEWEDRVATYEADDVNGYLTPMWRRKYPKGDTWDSKTEVGVYLLSPNQVNYTAKNNELNGQTYILGHINCQEWAKVVARGLDFELPLETIAEAAPMAATLASGAGLLANNPEKFTDFLEENPDAIASAVVDRAAYFRDNPEMVTSMVNKGANYVQNNKDNISNAVSHGATFISNNADTIAAVMGEGAKYLQKNPGKAPPGMVAHASYFVDNRDEISTMISNKSSHISQNPNKITDYLESGSRYLQENPDIVNNAVAKGAHYLEKNQEKISHAVSSGAKFAKKNPEVLAGVATGALFLAKAISKMATK
ncbi:unnamed protein product [Meganyctiphanes norvegica]|uniref:Uncharacterized protein n=1 Tax=Meganyctiphanes norvegica TaxID=48144 RepID=A0AAV2RPM5_MEGNR